MKTLPAILAVAIALVLTAAPMMTFAAGIVTFTSPTQGSTVNGPYTIAGQVSPAQSGADNLFIKVTSPTGTIVDAVNAPVTPTSGAFSYATTSGTSWVSGTYTITASDSYGATGSETFNFVAKTPPPSSGVALLAWATASTPINGGTSASVEATVAWNNGTVVKSTTFTGVVITPDGKVSTLGSPTAVSGAPGAFWWTIPTTSSQTGMWVVMMTASTGKYGVFTQTSFTVSDIATATSQASMAQSITALSSTLTSIQSSLSAVSQAVSGVQSSVSGVATQLNSLPSLIRTAGDKAGNLTSTLNTISSGITQLQGSVTSLGNQLSGVTTAANAAQSAAASANTAAGNAKDAINSTSTYVLVVVVIAAITLVLELAILVRKLS
jgi:uncharacterized protein YoxC